VGGDNLAIPPQLGAFRHCHRGGVSRAHDIAHIVRAMGRAKIMVIDDSEAVLETTGRALRTAGYDVVTRPVAIGASAAILRERANLVLLEISMPLVSGPEIVESLRAGSLPLLGTIVFHTDRPAEELEALARKHGVAGFVPKSLSRPEMLLEVARLLVTSRGSVATTAPGWAPEVVVAGNAETAGWARRALRSHAVVRCTDSGFDALSIASGRAAPDAMLLGSTLKDLPAVDVWERASRMDASWARRIVIVDEPGHELTTTPPGARRWSPREPLVALLDRLDLSPRS
jgi:DNA-binding response OmpR family regulator